MSHLGLKGWRDVERVIDEKNAIIAQLERNLAQAKTELREATWRPTARISELNWQLKDTEQELDQLRAVLERIGRDNHPYIQFWYAKLITAALDPSASTRAEIDPDLQMCIVCGTQWTAKEILPCPTPEKHTSHNPLDVINETLSKVGLPKVGYDVTGPTPEEFKVERPALAYKTRLDGNYWETGFCQNCSKVRYNTDNNHGLCGWCAEQLYPLES